MISHLLSRCPKRYPLPLERREVIRFGDTNFHVLGVSPTDMEQWGSPKERPPLARLSSILLTQKSNPEMSPLSKEA